MDDLGQIYNCTSGAREIMTAADAHSKVAELRSEVVRQNLGWAIGLSTLLVGLLPLLFGQRTANTVASITPAVCQLSEGASEFRSSRRARD